jgi:hypothetical protein
MTVGLVWLMVFNATFNNISAILWQTVFWWRKHEYTEKTIDLPSVTDKLYQIMLYRLRIRTYNISGDRY